MSGISTISTAYSKVRETTKNRLNTTISSVHKTAFQPTDPEPKTPTCECPKCGEITPLSIQIINPGESKTDDCSQCGSSFTVTFTQSQEWKIQ